MLNDAFRTQNRERQTQIFAIIESDKSFILNEKEWLSPFLSFNCVPLNNQNGMTLDQICEVLNLPTNLHRFTSIFFPSLKELLSFDNKFNFVGRANSHEILIEKIPKFVENLDLHSSLRMLSEAISCNSFHSFDISRIL